MHRLCTRTAAEAAACDPHPQAMLGLIVVVVLMGGIICVALVQTRSAYTASIGSLLDASDLRSPGSGTYCTASSMRLITQVTAYACIPHSTAVRIVMGFCISKRANVLTLWKVNAAGSSMSTADSGLASLTKSQAGFGGLSSGSGGSGIAAGTGGAAGSGGSMAVHSRGDEAFMDHSASATLDAHRVGAMISPARSVSD
jgi:hypothetical protein